MAQKHVLKLSSMNNYFKDEMKLVEKGENALESGHVLNMKYNDDTKTINGSVHASMKDKIYKVEKMVSLKLFFIAFSLSLLNNNTNARAQDEWVSPCPRLFAYEGKNNEPGKWYGIITLLSEIDVQGVWLRIIFDRPSLQLGNWFGQVMTSDNKDYLVKNRDQQLKAHVPLTVRFYVKYNPSEPAPKLAWFQLNTRTVCPKVVATEAPPVFMELQTSSHFGDADIYPLNISSFSVTKLQTSSELGTTPNPVGYGGGGGGGGNGPGGGGDFFKPPLSGSGSKDDYPSNVFSQQNQPTPPDNGDINAICGTVVAKPIEPNPLISYGETREGEHPWHAALYHAKGIALTYICGASLVSKYHVITVAQCVTSRRSQTSLNPDHLVVYLGKYYLRGFSSPGIQYRQVSKILPHPRYNAQTYNNDIALVKLTTPADFTDYVRPVCLWQESPDLTSVINKQGTIVGWGFDDTGKVAETLMQAQMPVVSQATCISSFPDFYSRYTSSKSFCAGYRNGTVCNGDAGSGMIFPKHHSNPNNPVWQLRGLVSFSVALQNELKCDASRYVVFTDSAKYLDWIRKSMKQ